MWGRDGKIWAEFLFLRVLRREKGTRLIFSYFERRIELSQQMICHIAKGFRFIKCKNNLYICFVCFKHNIKPSSTLYVVFVLMSSATFCDSIAPRRGVGSREKGSSLSQSLYYRTGMNWFLIFLTTDTHNFLLLSLLHSSFLFPACLRKLDKQLIEENVPFSFLVIFFHNEKEVTVWH